MEIRFFKKPHPTDPVEIVLITQLTEGVRIVEKHYEPGNFSIAMPYGALRGKTIETGDIALFDRGAFCGVVDDIVPSAGGNGERITISGYCLKGLLMQRLIVPTDYTSADGTAGYDARMGSSETIMKGFVSANLANPPQALRKVPNFTIASDIGRGIADDKYMARLEALSDVVGKIGADAKLGWNVYPVIAEGQPFGFVLDCVEGLDRTYGQTERPPAIFSIERRNVTDMEYRDSVQGYYNAFYTTRAGARFADEALTLLYWRDEEGQPTGYDRRERALSVSMANVPEGEEYAEMRRQALVQAKQYERIRTFKADISQSRMRYGIDFALGDMVTAMRPSWGITMDAQITEVTQEWGDNGYSIKATFGTDVPNIIKRLQNSIKELS